MDFSNKGSKLVCGLFTILCITVSQRKQNEIKSRSLDSCGFVNIVY